MLVEAGSGFCAGASAAARGSLPLLGLGRVTTAFFAAGLTVAPSSRGAVAERALVVAAVSAPPWPSSAGRSRGSLGIAAEIEDETAGLGARAARPFFRHSKPATEAD